MIKLVETPKSNRGNILKSCKFTLNDGKQPIEDVLQNMFS